MKETQMIDQFKLDMTMMYAVHDTFRRDLAQVTQMTARSNGWETFRKFLRAHHEAEDEALWPVVRKSLHNATDDLALLDQMEAEHAGLEPLLENIDDALDRGNAARATQTEMATLLQQHLTHEELAVLPVIDRALDEKQWLQFGQASTARIGPDMPTFLPWTLDGGDAERVRAILGHLPEPVQQKYRNEWQPAYAARNWWAPSPRVSVSKA